MTNLDLSNATRIGLNLVALLGGAVTLYLGRPVFVPLVIAIMLAFILWPIVRRLRGVGVPKFLACLVVVLGVVIVNLVVFFGILASVPRMLQGLPGPRYEDQTEFYLKIRGQVANLMPSGTVPEDVLPEDPERSQLFQYIRKTFTGDYVTNLLLNMGQFAAIWFWQGVLILFVLLFLLHEGEMLARRFRDIFGAGVETQSLVTGALEQIGQAIRDYLIWRTLVNVGLGLFLGAFYQFVFNLQQPWLWALLTMILCYVPYLGTIAAGIPPILDAFINVTPGAAFGILLFYSLVVTVEGYLIIPMVMGRSMDLNATTVILSCIFWELLWGLPGLFLAMPLMASVKAVCMHVKEWKPWGMLMSTEKAVDEAKVRDRVQQLGSKLGSDLDETTMVDEKAD